MILFYKKNKLNFLTNNKPEEFRMVSIVKFLIKIY